MHPTPKHNTDIILPVGKPRPGIWPSERIVAIGTSTGGTQALDAVLRLLPKEVPGIVVVQHMPPQFTGTFAERLDTHCKIEVREAKHGDRVEPGLALIAPGGKHMIVRRGMKEMEEAGAHTVAQDEKTCVVFGMPKVAIELGGVKQILPLDRIHEAVVAAGRR